MCAKSGSDYVRVLYRLLMMDNGDANLTHCCRALSHQESKALLEWRAYVDT